MQTKTVTLEQYMNLRPPSESRQPSQQCHVESPKPRVNLIPSASSDDGQQSDREPSSSDSSVSPAEFDDTVIQASITSSRTGVYFENVEIQSESMHPLQRCSIQEEKMSLHAYRIPSSGRPLSAAPALPTRCQEGLRKICFPPLHETKRTRPFTENKGTSSKKHRRKVSDTSPVTSREAQVKEASFMIEAALALANLKA